MIGKPAPVECPRCGGLIDHIIDQTVGQSAAPEGSIVCAPESYIQEDHKCDPEKVAERSELRFKIMSSMSV